MKLILALAVAMPASAQLPVRKTGNAGSPTAADKPANGNAPTANLNTGPSLGQVMAGKPAPPTFSAATILRADTDAFLKKDFSDNSQNAQRNPVSGLLSAIGATDAADATQVVPGLDKKASADTNAGQRAEQAVALKVKDIVQSELARGRDAATTLEAIRVQIRAIPGWQDSPHAMSAFQNAGVPLAGIDAMAAFDASVKNIQSKPLSEADKAAGIAAAAAAAKTGATTEVWAYLDNVSKTAQRDVDGFKTIDQLRDQLKADASSGAGLDKQVAQMKTALESVKSESPAVAAFVLDQLSHVTLIESALAGLPAGGTPFQRLQATAAALNAVAGVSAGWDPVMKDVLAGLRESSASAGEAVPLGSAVPLTGGVHKTLLAGQTLTTGPGESLQLMLADGSVLTLGPGSSVKLAGIDVDPATGRMSFTVTVISGDVKINASNDGTILLNTPLGHAELGHGVLAELQTGSGGDTLSVTAKGKGGVATFVNASGGGFFPNAGDSVQIAGPNGPVSMYSTPVPGAPAPNADLPFNGNRAAQDAAGARAATTEQSVIRETTTQGQHQPVF